MKKPALAFDQSQDKPFARELKQAVNTYLIANDAHKYADATFLAKGIFLVVVAAFFYGLSMGAQSLSVYALSFLAFMWTAMMLSMNFFHDASHGSVFRKPAYNRLLMAFVCIPMGTDPHYWALRHVYFHHSYPNIEHYDLDTEPNPLLRQTPFQPWAPQHQYQHRYWPLIAAISLGYLCWVSDWRDRFGKTPLAAFSYLDRWQYWLQFLLLKFAHISLLILLPIYCLADTDIAWWQIILVYLVTQACVSCFLVITILGTHWAEVEFFEPGADGRFAHSWYRHAFLTTCDWQARPGWLNNWLGGLDLHLTHHLLPGYSNRHYAKLKYIVAELAAKHGLPYRIISYRELFKMQQAFLRKMGKKPSP